LAFFAKNAALPLIAHVPVSFAALADVIGASINAMTQEPANRIILFMFSLPWLVSY
jgi:hypothetical protein